MDTPQIRLRLNQAGLAVLVAGILLLVSLAILQATVLAKARGKGAFGCGSLDQATIDSSAPGDTIMMMQFETTSGGSVAIGKELLIQGGWRPKTDDCQFDGNGNLIPEFFDTITDALVYFNYTPNLISDLPAPDDYLPTPGPIVIISPTLTSTLTLQQLRFDNSNINNQSGAGVSGVISNSAQVWLDQVEFANNTANPGNGGGLDLTVTGGSRLNISTADFNQNFATGNGGGARLILQNGSTVNLNNVNFSSFNEAVQGAGLYAEVRGGSNLTISEAQFSSGQGQSGGAFEIHVFDNSRVTIDNTQVSTNTASNGNGGGGRIVIHSGFVAVTNSSFFNNEASNGRGGGLAIEGVGGSAYVLLLNNTIINNTAAITGDNLYISGNVTIYNQQNFLPIVRKE